MAQYVYVENYGSKTYEEIFRGKKITIPSRGRIKMARREAVAFIGTMSANGYVDEDGKFDNTKPAEKKLRMVIDQSSKQEEQKPTCNLDGKEFDSDEELERYLKSVENKTVEKDENGRIVKRK